MFRLLSIVCILFLSWSSLVAQVFETYSPITLATSLQDFSIMDGKLEKYEFVVVGEDHWVKGNAEFQFGLFKYLHEAAGFNHFLIEYGEARAILLNLFPETGDKTTVNRLFIMKIDWQLYGRLKDYYDTTSVMGKFKIHGVDYEKDGIDNVKFAIDKIIEHKVIGKKEPSQHTLKFVNAYENSNYNIDKVELCYNFLEGLKKDSAKFKIEYGDYFDSMLRMHEAIKINVKGVKYGGKTHPLRAKRERLIYNQVVNLKNAYPNDKFFCAFGGAHVPLKAHDDYGGYENWNPFIPMLNCNEDSPLNSKVFSIFSIYSSGVFNWKNRFYKRKIGLSKTEIKELDEKSKPNKMTLFEYPSKTAEQLIFREEYFQMILVNRANWW